MSEKAHNRLIMLNLSPEHYVLSKLNDFLEFLEPFWEAIFQEFKNFLQKMEKKIKF